MAIVLNNQLKTNQNTLLKVIKKQRWTKENSKTIRNETSLLVIACKQCIEFLSMLNQGSTTPKYMITRPYMQQI
ncbi:hypothetical protein DSB67_17200 [Vibrio campbellii]|nr:hypothetical protein DSB67_17200 [Vibrio campbellii]